MGTKLFDLFGDDTFLVIAALFATAIAGIWLLGIEPDDMDNGDLF